MSTRPIHRFTDGSLSAVDDHLAEEEPLLIQLKEWAGPPRSVSVTMRTPGRDIDLALGFLFTEGILTEQTEIAKTEVGDNTTTIHLGRSESVDWQRLQRHSYTSSSCGVCGKTSLEQVHTALPFPEPLARWAVPATLISACPALLRSNQVTFSLTGGLHAAGLVDLNGKLLAAAEDIGRHNAVDKVVGEALRNDWLPLSKFILVLSGRAGFELVQKAAMAGIRVVAAVGAPSTLAVDLAEDQGITLCGFVRNGTFNCYTEARRITY